jgi:hypothetical protein
MEEKENKLESLEGKCIVREKRREYSTSQNYYYGGAGYGSEFAKAIIFDKDKIPDYIKNDSHEEIIFLDSEEGLELMVREIKRLQRYVNIEEVRVNDAKRALDKLYSFDLVQKWVSKYNKWFHPIIGISRDTENRIIEEIVSENKSK